MSFRTLPILASGSCFSRKAADAVFFLVDEQDEVESFARLDDLIELLRGLGIKFAEIHL